MSGGPIHGERTRIKHALTRMRACLDSIEHVLDDAGYPPGPDMVQALGHSAIDLATSLAKLEAYTRAAEAAENETAQ